MNGKWLAERILNGPFCRHETKEMALLRITPDYAYPPNLQANGAAATPPPKTEPVKNANLTLKEFLDKYSLPRIVKIIPEEPIATTEPSDPATLLNGTLLLYKQYRSGKIEARKFHDSRNAKSAESGQKDIASTIVIPDTYQGWFSVMTERGQVKARQYTTVQRLVAAQVTAFLIIGPDLIGYYQNHHKSADGARSKYQYIKTVVRSGQILKLLAVYEDIAEQSTRSKRLSWPLLGSKQQSTQYAQCMTTKKQIVYIPITTHGYFYAVSTANNTAEDNVSKVYQIAKLLQVFPLPVRVCSIYPQKLSGSILLENYHKEDVMLACVLDDKETFAQKFRFLEIDINSKFFVSLVADEHRLFKKARVQKALRNCHTDSDKWCQQLKVIHHIYPSKNHNAFEINENNKPNKRIRKLSLGDKKTVKSASFRYSTSYGAEDVKPPYRNLPATEVYNNKSNNQPPPVYLNIANKPNEENCSSLPIQKSDRGVFENEILQSMMNRQNGGAATAATVKPVETKNVEEKHPKERHRQFRKNNNITDSSYHKVHERELVVTSHETNKARVTKSCSNNAANERIGSKFNDLRYRVIKKENTYVERDLSNIPRQPVYKTQVMVKIDDSYSDAIDAIKSRRSSKDNIYAEINEYQSELSNGNFVIFPQKSSCFVTDNCSSSYIRVPSTSTVNVS